MERKNAIIKNTSLGRSGHNVMTAYLHLDYGGSGQGFGGYVLTGYDKKIGDRIGVSWGMEFIKRIIETVGVENWEDLPGKNIRVKADHSKVYSIGHIIKDEWFNPEEDLAFLLPKDEGIE